MASMHQGSAVFAPLVSSAMNPLVLELCFCRLLFSFSFLTTLNMDVAFYDDADLSLIYTSKFSLTSGLVKENLPTVHTSKISLTSFSLTSFPW